MRIAAVALTVVACAASSSRADIPSDISGYFDVDVDISKRGNDDYLAHFSVRDAVSGIVIAEPKLAFASKQPASFTIGARAGATCIGITMANAGWCMNIRVAADSDKRAAAYETIITFNGEVKAHHRFKSRLDV